MEHTRQIYAVGHGGMAVEQIGGYTVMYDCGSDTHQSLVKQYIDELAQSGCKQIDLFVLSHFDKDHVNTIDYLLTHITVGSVLVPLIPIDMKLVFDAASGGGYTSIMHLFNQNQCKVTQIGENVNGANTHEAGNNVQPHFQKINDLWQWNIHTMIAPNDWIRIKAGLQKRSFDLSRIGDLKYISNNIKSINRTFRSLWRSDGSNGKGLIMLSQRSPNANVIYMNLKYDNQNMKQNGDNTGCLYVGDANLSVRSNIIEIRNRICSQVVDGQLHLVQIPHHGSKYNVKKTFYTDFPSDFYYICDKDTARVSENHVIWPLTARTKMVAVTPQTTILDKTIVL